MEESKKPFDGTTFRGCNVDFTLDIPLSLAQAAHAGTSFVPDKRAQEERNEYASTLRNDFENLSKVCDTDAKRAMLAEEFDRYRAGYRRRFMAYLSARSRCVSSMIAGPSNFPAARMEKRNRIEAARTSELGEFRARALHAVRRKLQPELAPIMAGDDNATERLAAKIAEAQKMQEAMKAVNKAHERFLNDPASLETSGLSDGDKARVRSYKPEYSWEPHPYAPFALQNNSANIRRMKERLAQIETAKATPATQQENAGGVRMEDCPAENRVRLYFPGKPDEAVRAELKANAFRWTPTLGCWQAYRNSRSLEVAKLFLGGVA